MFLFFIYQNLWIIEIIGDQTINYEQSGSLMWKKVPQCCCGCTCSMQGKLQSCAMVWGPSIIKLSRLRVKYHVYLRNK